MKAAVLHQFGTLPVYEDFADPVAARPEELILKMRAASLKNLDRMRAKGTHYDKHRSLPAVVGVDGVGVLEDGRRVYAGSMQGMMADYTLVAAERCIAIPDNIDDVTAAALPNPALSAWFSLAYRAAIQPGDRVLILGATGVTGKIAIQLAKYLGAAHVVAAGRNAAIMDTLPALGADRLISLAQPEETLVAELKAERPFDIVIDYVWGRPAELVLEMLAGHDLNAVPHRTRYVQVGEMAGASISLRAGILRSAAIELYGIGGGSVPKEVMERVPSEILPLLFRLAAEGTLSLSADTMPLSGITEAWERGDRDGRRLVITMD
jgi:NADPH:quinone reductase-like Zn-dependent oxidoreductase